MPSGQPVPTLDLLPIVRGDSAVRSVILARRGIFTRAYSRQPLAAGDHVAWELSPPGGPQVVLSSKDGTALLDRDTSTTAIGFTAEATKSLPNATPYRIRLLYADGTVETWLQGNLPAQG